jgi:hypothetical protein
MHQIKFTEDSYELTRLPAPMSRAALTDHKQYSSKNTTFAVHIEGDGDTIYQVELARGESADDELGPRVDRNVSLFSMIARSPLDHLSKLRHSGPRKFGWTISRRSSDYEVVCGEEDRSADDGYEGGDEGSILLPELELAQTTIKRLKKEDKRALETSWLESPTATSEKLEEGGNEPKTEPLWLNGLTDSEARLTESPGIYAAGKETAWDKKANQELVAPNLNVEAEHTLYGMLYSASSTAWSSGASEASTNSALVDPVTPLRPTQSYDRITPRFHSPSLDVVSGRHWSRVDLQSPSERRFPSKQRSPPEQRSLSDRSPQPQQIDKWETYLRRLEHLSRTDPQHFPNTALPARLGRYLDVSAVPVGLDKWTFRLGQLMQWRQSTSAEEEKEAAGFLLDFLLTLEEQFGGFQAVRDDEAAIQDEEGLVQDAPAQRAGEAECEATAPIPAPQQRPKRTSPSRSLSIYVPTSPDEIKSSPRSSLTSSTDGRAAVSSTDHQGTEHFRKPLDSFKHKKKPLPPLPFPPPIPPRSPKRLLGWPNQTSIAQRLAANRSLILRSPVPSMTDSAVEEWPTPKQAPVPSIVDSGAGSLHTRSGTPPEPKTPSSSPLVQDATWPRVPLSPISASTSSSSSSLPLRQGPSTRQFRSNLDPLMQSHYEPQSEPTDSLTARSFPQEKHQENIIATTKSTLNHSQPTSRQDVIATEPPTRDHPEVQFQREVITTVKPKPQFQRNVIATAKPKAQPRKNVSGTVKPTPTMDRSRFARRSSTKVRSLMDVLVSTYGHEHTGPKAAIPPRRIDPEPRSILRIPDNESSSEKPARNVSFDATVRVRSDKEEFMIPTCMGTGNYIPPSVSAMIWKMKKADF